MFAVGAMDGLKSTCKHELDTIPFYTEMPVAAEVTEEIVSKVCYQDCSGNGNCVQGRNIFHSGVTTHSETF